MGFPPSRGRFHSTRALVPYTSLTVGISGASGTPAGRQQEQTHRERHLVTLSIPVICRSFIIFLLVRVFLVNSSYVFQLKRTYFFSLVIWHLKLEQQKKSTPWTYWRDLWLSSPQIPEGRWYRTCSQHRFSLYTPCPLSAWGSEKKQQHVSISQLRQTFNRTSEHLVEPHQPTLHVVLVVADVTVVQVSLLMSLFSIM